MSEELIWYIINTLESLTVVSTEDNLSKLLAVITTLKKFAKQNGSSEGGEQDA